MRKLRKKEICVYFENFERFVFYFSPRCYISQTDFKLKILALSLNTRDKVNFVTGLSEIQEGENASDAIDM